MKKIMFNDKYGLTQAVLERRKTQTRRIIKSQCKFRGQDVNGYYVYRNTDGVIDEVCMKDYDDFPIDEGQILPKYKIGEIVAVAQSYKSLCYQPTDKTPIIRDNKIEFIEFQNHKGWNNKIFVRSSDMSHQIRITDVRVERLQDISDECCLKEGVVKDTCKTYFNGYTVKFSLDQYNNMLSSEWFKTPREAFANLIDKVGGKGTWDSNPYVWVYDFKLIK